MKIIFEEGDPCPACGSKLILEEQHDEDNCVFLVCPESSTHYMKFVGLADDLNE